MSRSSNTASGYIYLDNSTSNNNELAVDNENLAFEDVEMIELDKRRLSISSFTSSTSLVRPADTETNIASPSELKTPNYPGSHVIASSGERQFTLRAVLVGCLLGTLISASNFYVGLRLGWTFGAGIFGSIFGFSIIQFLIKSGIGSSFHPQEHATLSSVATAAGSGTLAGYISGIPAMYRLGLLTDISQDMTKLTLWSLAACLYGIFFAIPLRKWFVLKQKLAFPSPTATAEIIRSLHAVGGEQLASKKTKALMITFSASMFYLIVAWFIPVLKTWRLFYWLSLGFTTESTIHKFLVEANEWNFYITLSWAFIGAGMMTPLNTTVSANAGSLLGWGILGPILLAYGIAPGDRHQMKGTIIDGQLVGVTEVPTARYWLLWPGLFMMIAASFTELGCQGNTIIRGLKSALFNLFKKEAQQYDELETENVPKSWWIPGLIFSILFSIIVLSSSFGDSNLQEVSFPLFQLKSETDINPIGTIAKASQIIFSFLPPYNPTAEQLIVKQIANLSAGLVSASAASQAVDMVSDLKTGHLVQASPRAQFLGQFVGSIYGAFIGLGFWRLFSSAYPCIVSTSLSADKDCERAGFGLQAVTAWQGITIALTKSNSIPTSSFVAALILGFLTITTTIIKNTKISPRFHYLVPSLNAIGIAFVNTDPSLFIAMLIGSIVSKYWKEKYPSNYSVYMYAVSSGLIAGEGVFGLLQALLSIWNVPEGLITRWGVPN